ncbi:MAG TPA: SDR family oxidoreductase [Steroidobacteraceae bacterium]|nr:SDR family oxidoreductase [Steroidobacteraceae bacterium]
MRSPRPRTVIVTGGTAGVGRAIVERFARAGDRVGVLARDPLALEELRQELLRAGAQVAVEPVDVSNAEAVFEAALRLEQSLGKIDIWVNDAMLTVFSPLGELTAEEFRRVTEVTYLGCVHGTMAALRFMRPRRRGRIIQIGSALAYHGIPLQSAYCGAKHAIRGFTEAVRGELLHDGSGVQISIVELPAVNTPQFDWARVHTRHAPRPMGHPVQPEVAADAVFRAAEGPWREYWLGLPTVLLILANTIVPAFLTRYLAWTAVSQQQTPEPVEPGRQDNLERPVTALHRTRGSFSAEARQRAPLVPGDLARLATFALGALLCVALGAGLGRRLRAHR